MCITDKQKRPAAALISFDVGLLSLLRAWGVRSASRSGRLSHPPASMLLLYHMQVVHGVASFIRCVACALARCPGRPVLCVLRAWLPRSLACLVCCALVPGLPCLLVPWSLCCVGGLCAWCPGLLACPVWVGCVRPCGLSGWTLFSGPVLWPPWRASEKGLYFRPVFFRNF